MAQVEKSPKPVASCAMPVMPGMRVKTDSEKTKAARLEAMVLCSPVFAWMAPCPTFNC